MKTDILIVGCGVAGLNSALHLPEDKHITIITKSKAEESDSFLAQGGICVLPEESDYDAFFEDTLKAGHYANNRESVDIMIRSSQDVIHDLVCYGADFQRNGDDFVFTKEGAHSRARILYHKDETGKEITQTLLNTVTKRSNITLIEQLTMVDILSQDNCCYGIIGLDKDKRQVKITADYTLLATGGIGGLFDHSTNYPHLTGDSLAIALNHDIQLKNIDYIQIHPTTLFTKEKQRSFLISESVRGEGAVLLNCKGERFVNELLPRDVVSKAIFDQMKKEGSDHVWLSMEPIGKEEILSHFPNIYQRCLQEGYDVTKQAIPVVPAQHYFMGGIAVNRDSKTSMDHLYAIGETACNGVHGKNRLASNSLLESLVFAKRAAKDIGSHYQVLPTYENEFMVNIDSNYVTKYKDLILKAIEKEKTINE